ncbi:MULTISPECIES: cation:proton antiporter [unclassified Streptomyces]|uniref:cation:proton antiporter n=1 Tax=unclassified Streptomyces TaxID=2593676 RepID=UPI002E108384|nr:cation:proton antiporter [Streptomyces sp. NBC_01236]
MTHPHTAEALQATAIAGIAGILIAGTVLAHLARRVRQPAVIGEITAGILLGPSLLGLLPGNPTQRLFPDEVRPLLSMVAQLGLLLFMFTVGWELDWTTMKRRKTSVAGVTAGSILAPMVLGFGVAALIYHSHSHVNGEKVPFSSFALYLGVSMSITAFPVLARILKDNNLGRTKIGALALTSAAFGDVLAWCLLAGVVAIVTASGPSGFTDTLWMSAGYGAAMIVVVRPLLARGVARISKRGTGVYLAALVTAGLLLSAYTTSRIGIHPIFGAFAFGLVMPRKPEALLEEKMLRPLQHAGELMLPVYFIVTGLSVDVAAMSLTAWGELGLILSAAILGKLLGAGLPAKSFGLGWRESTGVGVLMNTRGLTELIILGVGLNLGVLDHTLFTEMVLMALITTAMTGPLLPFLFPRSRMDLIATPATPSTPAPASSVVRMPEPAGEQASDLAG